MGKGLLDWLLEDDVLEVRFGLQKKQTGSIQSNEAETDAEPLLMEDLDAEGDGEKKPAAPSIASVQRQNKGGSGRWIGLAVVLLLGAIATLLFAPVPEPLAPIAVQLRNAIGLGSSGVEPSTMKHAAVPASAPTSAAAPMTAPSTQTADTAVTAPTAATAVTETEMAVTAETAATAESQAGVAVPPEPVAAPEPVAVWYIEAGPFESDDAPAAVASAGYDWATTTDELERSGRQVVASHLTDAKARELLDALEAAGIEARIRTSATGISVVAGPFDTRAAADKAAIEMAKLGAPASASDVQLRIKRYWARIGPIRDATAAGQLAEQLKRQTSSVQIREALETP